MMMGSANGEGVSYKACLAGKGGSLSKRRNAVDAPFPTCPERVSQMYLCCVALLDKGTTIACGQRLAWAHLGDAEPINTTLSEY